MRDPATRAYIPAAWETVSCPVCNSNEYTLYERFGSDLQYTYVKCNNCSLIYHSPRPRYDQDFIDSCYSSYYQYAENLTPDDLNSIKESSLDMFRKEIAYLMKFDESRTSLLDVGSGMGTFLLAAKPFYKERVGLDVSHKMAEFVRQMTGATTMVTQFENFEWPASFSLIHMSHVIEHIPNPNLWLSHAKKLLAKDGILVINVPNKMGLSYKLKHWYYKLGLIKQFSLTWNDPARTPDHLYEPTIKSFLYLIRKNGYKVLEYYTYSRRDPTSRSGIISKILNRKLYLGSNMTFIVMMS